MNGPHNHWRRTLRTAAAMVFLAVSSAVTALYLVNMTIYWRFIAILPESVLVPLNEVSFFLAKPILLSDTAFAEEQLEFYQATFLCAAVFITSGLLVSTLRVCLNAKRHPAD